MPTTPSARKNGSSPAAPGPSRPRPCPSCSGRPWPSSSEGRARAVPLPPRPRWPWWSSIGGQHAQRRLRFPARPRQGRHARERGRRPGLAFGRSGRPRASILLFAARHRARPRPGRRSPAGPCSSSASVGVADRGRLHAPQISRPRRPGRFPELRDPRGLGAWVVQTRSFSWIPVLWTVPMSMLVIGILHANNWRDILLRCRDAG